MCVNCIAYHKVSSVSESEQEADQHSKEHGEVVTVSDSWRHSLSAFKLGFTSWSSKFGCLMYEYEYIFALCHESL